MNAKNGQLALALPGGDPFAAYASSVTPTTIIGTLLKFSKGEFLAGKDNEVIPAGSRFIANIDALMVGWVKWINGRPVDHKLVRVVDGLLPPQRDALGDDDEDKWRFDSRGQPRDPWQEVNYLLLLDAQGQLFTFSITQVAGIREVGALCAAYADHRKNDGESFPLVELNVDSFQHRDRSIGRIKYPRLDIVGWEPKTDFNDAMASAGVTPPSPPPKQPAPGRITASPRRMAESASGLDDEIPF